MLFWHQNVLNKHSPFSSVDLERAQEVHSANEAPPDPVVDPTKIDEYKQDDDAVVNQNHLLHTLLRCVQKN